MDKLWYLRRMHIHFYNENDTEMSHYYFDKWIAEAERLKRVHQRNLIHTQKTLLLGV